MSEARRRVSATTGCAVELLGQLAGLVLQTGLDLAQAPTRPAAARGELSVVLGSSLLVGLRLLDDLLLPLGERLELVAHASELLVGELFLGIAPGLLDFILSLLEVGECLFLFLGGLVALVLVEVTLGLRHSFRGGLAGAGGGIGAQLGEPLELAFEVLLDLGLFLGQALQLVASLLGVGVLASLLGLLEVLCLLGPGLGEVVLGVLEFLDQPGQLALATVLDRVDQVAELVASLILAGSRGAHLVLLQLLGGLAELAGGPLLLALLGGLAHRRGRQGVRLVESFGHLAHPLLELLQARAHLRLPRGQVGQVRLLLGREFFDRLAHRLGPGRGLGRLLHGLLVLLEQFLGILHDPAVGLEFAEAIEHFLKLVGDRFLIRLGLGQRLASGIVLGAWCLVLGRLRLLGTLPLWFSALIARLGAFGLLRILRSRLAGFGTGLILDWAPD